MAARNIVNDVLEVPLTFRTAEGREKPPYRHFIRTIGLNSLPDGTDLNEMVTAEVSRWIEDGYALIGPPIFLGQNKGAGGEFLGYIFSYHFILK